MHVAEFSEKQPKVRVNQVNGDKWFYIALNETEINRSDENTNTSMTLYRYDYNDFMDNSINQDDIQNNPEKYLNYTPQTEIIDADSMGNDDRISVLEENQQIIIAALAEIIGGEGMDAKTKLMLLAIRNRIKNGEDIDAILESYPKLTQKQISEIKNELNSK